VTIDGVGNLNFLRSTARSAKRVLAIVILSVRHNTAQTGTHSMPGERLRVAVFTVGYRTCSLFYHLSHCYSIAWDRL